MIFLVTTKLMKINAKKVIFMLASLDEILLFLLISLVKCLIHWWPQSLPGCKSQAFETASYFCSKGSTFDNQYCWKVNTIIQNCVIALTHANMEVI